MTCGRVLTGEMAREWSMGIGYAFFGLWYLVYWISDDGEMQQAHIRWVMFVGVCLPLVGGW